MVDSDPDSDLDVIFVQIPLESSSCRKEASVCELYLRADANRAEERRMHVASAQPLFPYASKHVLSCGAFVVQEEPPKLLCRQHLGQRTRRFFELVYQHISVQPSGSPIVVNRFNPQTTSLRLPKPILIVAYKLKPPMPNFCLAILCTKVSLTQRRQCLSRHKTNPIDSPQQFIFLYC